MQNLYVDRLPHKRVKQSDSWHAQYEQVHSTGGWPPSRGREFTEDDAFFGYQKETPAAVVFQATHQLEREGLAISPGQGWEKTEPISVSEPGAEKKVENSQVWKENVSCLLHRCIDLTLLKILFSSKAKMILASSCKVYCYAFEQTILKQGS